MADMLRIPEDSLTGMLRITLTGDRRALVENYCSILEYSDQRIKLLGRQGGLLLEGEGLVIEYYAGSDMLIRGRIKKLLLDDALRSQKEES